MAESRDTTNGPREKQERLEAARIRDAILEGYQDLASGRTVDYRGDLRALLVKPRITKHRG